MELRIVEDQERVLLFKQVHATIQDLHRLHMVNELERELEHVAERRVVRRKEAVGVAASASRQVMATALHDNKP